MICSCLLDVVSFAKEEREMDAFIKTPKFNEALKMHRARCKGGHAQRLRDQLVEESGEMSCAMARMSRQRATIHDFEEEAADLMICMFALLEAHGRSVEDFQETYNRKVDKWHGREQKGET
jgi:NTP pyrophosphatase (non-canonical NTP hydrolase)